MQARSEGLDMGGGKCNIAVAIRNPQPKTHITITWCLMSHVSLSLSRKSKTKTGNWKLGCGSVAVAVAVGWRVVGVGVSRRSRSAFYEPSPWKN